MAKALYSVLRREIFSSFGDAFIFAGRRRAKRRLRAVAEAVAKLSFHTTRPLRAGRKIRSAAKNFSGRVNVDAAPRPEILFSLTLKDNLDPPSRGRWKNRFGKRGFGNTNNCSQQGEVINGCLSGYCVARKGRAWGQRNWSRETLPSSHNSWCLMKNELGIFRLVGSRQAFRPSRTAALLAAHDLYTKGEQLTAILNVGRDERMDANAIVAAWRELGLF